MEPFKVFVSSTSRDLMAERTAVAEVLRTSELLVMMMENWYAIPSDATTVSLDGVSRCDIFVGIYAFRYGFIPPESTTSITEQEYEMARREGKRCLCYFKDETNVPPVDDDPGLVEPATSLDKLAAFKARIEQELVRAKFTSPGDLATKLALDISRLRQGYLPGYSRRDLLKRWANRGIDTRNQLVQGALSGHTNLLPSPILDYWSMFIEETAWHDSVLSDLHSINELSSEFPRLSDLSKRASDLADRLDHGDDSGALYKYHTILTELDKTITDSDIKEVEEVVQQLRKNVEAPHRPDSTPSPNAHEKLSSARDLRRELRNTRERVKRPSFEKCFPVIGSLGSGRTHFVASLLGSTPDNSINADEPWCENNNFLVLLLNQSSNKSLEETIVDAINRASGLQWRTLDEFDRFLVGKSLQGEEEHDEIRFCIAIDDLQRWLNDRNKSFNALDELTQFIQSHTHLSSLFWLFTLQDTSYSMVQPFNGLLKSYSYFQTEIQPDANRDFRGQQTTEPKVNHISGWLTLDDLNREEEFGLQLIETGLERQGASLPDLDLLRENPSVLRNLIKPFVASVLLDLHSEGKLDLQRIATLSYMGFVKDFWERRYDEFITEYNRLRYGNSQDVENNDSSEALRLVAETLSQTGEFNPLQRDLEKLVVEAARKHYSAPEPMVTAVLGALTKSGFLKRYLDADPEMPQYQVQRIGFEFEPFWQLRLAEHIRAWKSFKELDETAARDDLINWFGVVESNEIEEGVLEFLLLLLDNEAESDIRKRSFVNFLQRSAIDSTELPQEAVWFSGVNATLDSQVMLMGLVGQGKNDSRAHRLLHSIMYFLVEALPEVSEPADRFRLLQPHYDDINRESLSTYFLYVASRLLVQTKDNFAVLRAMRYLSNSEVMGIGEDLAALTVNILFRNAINYYGDFNEACLKSLVRIILDYLKDIGEEAKNEEERRGETDHWKRYSYREWVLRFFCSRLAHEIGVDTYHLLAEFQWYNARKLNISARISSEMRREANFALGDWYRIRRREKEEQYVTLIRDLVNSGNSRDRETAFYLIRHSERTRGESEVLVDDVFAPMLKDIFLDPKLDVTVNKYYALFSKNLSAGFEDLEALREKVIPKKGPGGRPNRRRNARDNRSRGTV